eukprot:2392896-Prymnesium_polylepis.1
MSAFVPCSECPVIPSESKTAPGIARGGIAHRSRSARSAFARGSTPGSSCAAADGSDAEKSGIACLQSRSAAKCSAAHGHAPRYPMGIPRRGRTGSAAGRPSTGRWCARPGCPRPPRRSR